MAGTAPGYANSPTLHAANLVLSEDNLDKWLWNPQVVILKCRMSDHPANPFDPGDLISAILEA